LLRLLSTIAEATTEIMSPTPTFCSEFTTFGVKAVSMHCPLEK
jgi:hypothetical protein